MDTTDVDAEVRRHTRAGAAPARRTPAWATLRDLVARKYCIIARDPVSGILSPAT